MSHTKRHGTKFQSTLPCGSDGSVWGVVVVCGISIHAPLRERQVIAAGQRRKFTFQSTLPCGSDFKIPDYYLKLFISIHAPLRERPSTAASINLIVALFQSTLPCGSDCTAAQAANHLRHFNPRSLAGATEKFKLAQTKSLFQSTLPCGSDGTP